MSLNILQRGPTSFNVTGATNWGLADPGCSALDSLLQVVTTTLLSRQADPVDPFDLVMVEALCVLRDEATEAFAAAHKKLGAEESSIWGSCDPPLRQMNRTMTPQASFDDFLLRGVIVRHA